MNTTTNNDETTTTTTTEEKKEIVKLLVRIIRDQIEISIYTFETPLHRRGYRYETAKAPLREDIAYALVYSTLSSLKKKKKNVILMDPFCGSGTIAIEAASIIQQLPPGRFQTQSPFHSHSISKFYLPTLWNQYKQKQQQQQHTTIHKNEQHSIIVIASDRDPGAIQATTNNAKRAGLLSYMNIYQSSFPSSLQSFYVTPSSSSFHNTQNEEEEEEDEPLLLVVTNPPFGKRITSNHKRKKKSTTNNNELLPLYQSIYNHTIQKHKIPITLLSNDYQLIQSSIHGTETMTKGMKKYMTHTQLFTTQHGGIKVYAISTTPTTTTTTTITTTTDVDP